jgi:two-component system, sensor histidine kinase
MNPNESILIEQMRYLHRNVPTYAFTNIFSVSIMAIIFWDSASRPHLIAWVLAVAALSTYRVALWRRFLRHEFTLEIARRWLRRMFLGPGLSGLFWGLAALFIVPEVTIIQQFVFLCAFVLYAVSSMFNYSAYFPSYLCVFLPFGLFIIGAAAAGKMTYHPAFSAVLFLFVLSITLVARRFNRTFIESLHLRFENIGLIQQLTIQKDAAEAANFAKSRFLAAASHDLRQPMHAISLYLGTLAGFKLPVRARELLTKARQCAQTMDDMFRALLDMSRLDASVVQPKIRVFPIASILDQIRVQFEPYARTKGLALRIAPCSAFVRCDLAMAERIVRNLAANAVRYTEQGKILVGCRRKGDSLRVGVYDTGPGIPKEKHILVFEEFYQIDNPERDRTKGLGLGLAIVKRLAKLLSCPITLKSQSGRGSVFAIDLPLITGNYEPILPSSPITPGGEKLAGRLVVVIDDEEPILDATRSLLEQWGCSVVTAISGKEAIDRLIASPRVPDVLICDYRLRGEENGIKVVAALRTEFNEDIPALLITGDTAPERIREIQGSNLPMLHKPIEENTLRSALLQLIENS